MRGDWLGTVVAYVIHTIINAIGAWIVLDNIGITNLGFWSYILIGFGLCLIMNGNINNND